MPARTNAPVGRGLQLATKYCKFLEGRESIKIASALPALLDVGIVSGRSRTWTMHPKVAAFWSHHLLK